MNQSPFCPFCFQAYTGYGSCPYCGHIVGEPRSGAQQLPLGTILDGKYQLGMVLGQGGFGITYLAYDLTLRMRVAIKEYFPLGLVTRQKQTVTFTGGNAQPFFQKGVEAFYREAQLLARFQTHPNIVHVSSFFRQNGTAYFVMEYVKGESLSAYLDRCGGRLSYDETVRLLIPVFDALSDVHNVGILHRDIAPDNICLTKDGNVKLLDFGAAKNELSIHTHSSAAILKPGYAPMEQYTAGSNQGPWTDIYAMGAVIYRCLTGNVPPDAPDRIIGQPLLSFKEANVSAPAGAEAAINKALALDIQNRWQRVADFRNALIDPSALKNIKPQLQKQEKSQKQISRKPWLIPVLIIAAIFLIAGVIISQAILPQERVYREGTSLIAEGKYEDAILKFSEISSYKDSEQQIRRAKSLQAEKFLSMDDYDNAMTLFTELSGKEYASERIAQKKDEYERLHPATPEPTAEIKPIATNTLEPIPDPAIDVGDLITFGKYEQDNDLSNGAEPIEWQVLAVEDDRALLISKYGLDTRPYNDKDENVTWKTSTLRKWLNEDFYEKSFNDSEKKLIFQVINKNPESPIYKNDVDYTDDNIFLLSINEINLYFVMEDERLCKATEYAKKIGAYVENRVNEKKAIGNSYWWLRSIGGVSSQAVNVRPDGDAPLHGDRVDCVYITVRPVLWLDISKSGNTISGKKNNELVTDSEKIEPQSRITQDSSIHFSNDIQVGDIVQFGSYEQDGDGSNGKEPIEWIVLEKNEDKILLLSKYLIDNVDYHNKNEQVTWENCYLRKWLNETFLNNAFTYAEQSNILETEIITPDTYFSGQLYADGTKVIDRCFILSYDEISTLLQKENFRARFLNDVLNLNESTIYWWIRGGNYSNREHKSSGLINGVELWSYDVDIYLSLAMSIDGTITSITTQQIVRDPTDNRPSFTSVRPAVWVKTKPISEVTNK